MECVRSRLGHDIDDGAAGEPKFRVVLSGVNLQFLDAIDRRGLSYVSVLRFAIGHSLDENAVRVGINSTQRGKLIARLPDGGAVFAAVLSVVAAAGSIVGSWHEIDLVEGVSIQVGKTI